MLDAFFDEPIERFTRRNIATYRGGIGWGLKGSAQRIEKTCLQHQLSFSRIEDGFIANLDHPTESKTLLSIVYDDQGIYYDATRPSSLEALIASKQNDCARGAALIDRLRSVGISKYNLVSTHCSQSIPLFDVLIVDQTVGDLSIPYSYANEDSFKQMLADAIAENPNKRIAIKTHPDVILGKKQGYFDPNEYPNLTFIGAPLPPSLLFKDKPKVYSVCSLLGFEALIFDCQVFTYGCPFYAGWGLTHHRGREISRRKSPRTINQLVEAAYIDYCRYVHPDTQQRCTVEDIIDYIALQKSPIHEAFQASCNELSCSGFSVWKKGFLPTFLNGLPMRFRFEKRPSDKTSLEWGQKVNTNSIQVEDGFIRSAGLGADLKRPCSLVFDSRGMYFDPTQISDLEVLIQNQTLTNEQIHRAQNLKQQLIESGTSKYNIAGSSDAIETPINTYSILVVGQVEDDASIQCGSVDVASNTELLTRVRAEHPNAFIIYKPHPDVESGNRKGAIAANTLTSLCDLNGKQHNIIKLINLVDEVHTLTSLSGFEALIRNKKVTCWGRPFYSGWGLTHDKHSVDRRTKSITQAELIYAALIAYPLYINWQTGRFTTPEFIVHQLAKKQGHQTSGVSALLRKTRYFIESALT